LGIFRRRLASKREYRQLFLVCLVPVHVWAVLALFHRFPTLVLQMNAFELMSLTGYVLTFALLESMLLFGLLFIASILLPARFIRPRLVPAGTIFVLLASVSAVLIHLYQDLGIEVVQFNVWAAGWAALGLASTGVSVHWLGRHKQGEKVVQLFVERLAPLAMSYLFFDLLGMFVILARNLP
jgi:hypothetical protein